MLVALDLETFLMDKDNVSPKPVCLSYYSEYGDRGIVAGDDRIKEVMQGFLQHEELIFHNAKFDLGVIATHYPDLIEDIFTALSDRRIHCTQIREQLYILSTKGTSSKLGESLSNVVERRLGKDISRYKKGDGVWRLRYSELYGMHPREYPFGAKKYCILDVKDTLAVYKHQQENKSNTGNGSMNTEHLQVYTSFALQLSTIQGVCVDRKYASEISDRDMKKYNSALDDLVNLGYANRNNKGEIVKENKKIKEYLADKYPDDVKYTTHSVNPQVKIGLEDLKKLPSDELIDKLIVIGELQKNCTTYYPPLKNDRLHPNYGILKATGRTCSYSTSLYPSINIQQLPRDEGIREALVPKPGNVFIGCDYEGLELCSVSQTTLNLFNESGMADKINSGYDLHSYMGSVLMGISYEEFMKRKDEKDSEVLHWRSVAKPINLGIPGGMYPRRMAEWARDNHGIDMTYKEAKGYRKLYMKEYPEIQKFFNYITKKYGRDGAMSYSVNGRHRAQCRFTDMSNGFLMQSLSADGAKIAVCDVTKAFYNKSNVLYGSNMIAFVHDEIIIETSKDNIENKTKALANIMIEAMKCVMPDIRITCEAAVMDRWAKKGPFLHEGKFSKGGVHELAG
jgi:DNA polymerase I-like protein with 3'-5' exonuclease and polymerase domains